MNAKRFSERGQAIVILAITLIVLLGFTAMAIDGGMVYADRRRLQNATDSAALAGALQKVNGADNSVVLQQITYSLQGNGYDMSQVETNIEKRSNFSGEYFLITVAMTRTTNTSFIQLLYGGEMRNHVIAVARARHSQPALPGMAIMTMGNCISDDDNKFGASLIGFAGGGHDAVIRSYNGGVFINTPENGSNYCAIDPPHSQGSVGVEVNDGYTISSVGGYNYEDHPGADKIIPLPVTTNVNGGVSVDDPLESLPEPQCTNNGSFDSANQVYRPGRYTTLPDDYPLGSGIYCVTGSVKMAGQKGIESAPGAGVVIYMQNEGLWMTGNGDFKINAPTTDNCLGTVGDPTASCTYRGVAVFMARDNPDEIELSGNGEYRVNGLVYHINGTVSARGGGHSPDDYVINGQLIAKRIHSNGQSDFTVTYNAGYTYWLPPTLSLER